MIFEFRDKHLRKIRDCPHLIGHMVGKDKLTEQHSEWIKYVWDSKEHRSLQGHRGSYKTTAVTEIGIIWWLLFHPNDRIALIRKPYTEAAKTLRTVKDYFKLEVIQALFYFAHGMIPAFRQAKENSLILNFKKTITKEGSADAYGVGGNITGNHYDKIICDDFVTLKDRVSKAERESTKEFIREVITNIVDPGKQCGFIGTPWHKSDSWEVVPDPAKYDVDSTGILSDIDKEEKRSRTTSVLWAANYLLKHIVREDAIFSDPIYQKWDWKRSPVYAHLDCKYKGSHTNALTIMAELPGNKYQAIGWSFEENIKEKIQWVAEKCNKYRVNKIYNEENPDKGYTGDELKKEGLLVKTYHESTNKHVKIVNYLKGYWPDIFWSGETDDEYMEQITDYEEAQEPDDAPDSAASLIREAFHKGPADGLWEM